MMYGDEALDPSGEWAVESRPESPSVPCQTSESFSSSTISIQIETSFFKKIAIKFKSFELNLDNANGVWWIGDVLVQILRTMVVNWCPTEIIHRPETEFFLNPVLFTLFVGLKKNKSTPPSYWFFPICKWTYYSDGFLEFLVIFYVAFRVVFSPQYSGHDDLPELKKRLPPCRWCKFHQW